MYHLNNLWKNSCFGGAEEDRTPDPLRARQVLSQLSYDPFFTHKSLFTCPCILSLARLHTLVWFFARSNTSTLEKIYSQIPLLLWCLHSKDNIKNRMIQNNYSRSNLKTNCVGTLILIVLFLRRWSSRRFPYGYLVTTSPQSWTTPWQTSPRRLDYLLLVQPTPMVWRAVCTRPGNVFTATCWSAITSDSDFM